VIVLKTIARKDSAMEIKEWARFQEFVLKSQLNAIKAFLREEGSQEVRAPRERSRSQISMAYDILSAANEPLHISEIIKRAKERFGVDIDPESITSSMIKKVHRGKMFKRVGRNTFAILEAPPDPGGHAD
jgi:hypothetical protein